MVSVEQANGVLAQIQDAGSGRAVTELSWIDQVRVEGSRVVFRLALPGFAQGPVSYTHLRAHETR